MKRIGLIGVVLGALALSACTQDVVIRNNEGVTVIGVVQGEYVNSKVDISTDDVDTRALGVFSTSQIVEPFATAWGEYDKTALLERKFGMTITTGVTYIGNKGKATMIIDKRSVVCPIGFMVGTCLSAIETQRDEVLGLYKEKFSYLK